MDVHLFGSRRRGLATPESDWDLLLRDARLSALLPTPFPSLAVAGERDATLIFQGRTDLLRRERLQHHKARHAWSTELWERLGGNAGVLNLKTQAIEAAGIDQEGATPEMVDLCLYVPPSIWPQCWAVYLGWRIHLVSRDLAFLWAMDLLALGRDKDVAALKAEVHARPKRKRDRFLLEQFEARFGLSLPEPADHYASLPLLDRNPSDLCVLETGLP